MKNWTRTSLIAMAILAAPAVATAQTPGHGGQAATTERFVPTQVLLRMQAELGLTGEQVSQLEGIAERLAAQNQPIAAQLRELGVGHGWARPGQQRDRAGGHGQMAPEQREQMRERMQDRRDRMAPEQREQMRERMQDRRDRMTPEQREQMRERMRQRQLPAEAQPLVQQLRANATAALAEARDVLTPEQQARAQELLRERMAERGARSRGGQRGWSR